MSAPTSVSAIRLMRDQTLSFRVRQSAWAMQKSTTSAEPESPAREPLAGEREDADSEQPEPVASRAGGWTGRARASWDVSVTGRGSSSSEYCSTATVPPPPPEADSGTPRAEPHRGPASPSKWRVSAGGAPGAAPGQPSGGTAAPEPAHSNDTGRPSPPPPAPAGPPSGRVHAAEEPAGRRRHPGPVALLAGAAAEGPAPEPVDRHDHSANSALLAAEDRRPLRPAAAELGVERHPVAGPVLHGYELDRRRKGVHRLAQECSCHR